MSSTIGIGPLTETLARQQVVSFSKGLDIVSLNFFIKTPSDVYNYTAYLEPLTFWSWVSIIIFLFISPVLLFTMTRLVKEPSRMSFIESFEAVYVALISMDSPFKPLYFTSRAIFGR